MLSGMYLGMYVCTIYLFKYVVLYVNIEFHIARVLHHLKWVITPISDVWKYLVLYETELRTGQDKKRHFKKEN